MFSGRGRGVVGKGGEGCWRGREVMEMVEMGMIGMGMGMVFGIGGGSERGGWRELGHPRGLGMHLDRNWVAGRGRRHQQGLCFRLTR